MIKKLFIQCFLFLMRLNKKFIYFCADMTRFVNKTSIRVFAILHLSLMSMMILDKAFFLHTHKLNDGTIIVHAHPYNKTSDSEPFKKHHHTDTLFHFYHIINLLFPAILSAIVLVVMSIITKLYIVQSNQSILKYTANKSGRAPPVSIF